MRLKNIKRWNRQSWTQLYEAALFERDTVKLCALIWSAQLAILGREKEIENLASNDKAEIIALERALDILRELGRLSGLDIAMQRTIEFSQTTSPTGDTIRKQVRKNRSARMAA